MNANAPITGWAYNRMKALMHSDATNLGELFEDALNWMEYEIDKPGHVYRPFLTGAVAAINRLCPEDYLDVQHRINNMYESRMF